MAAVLQEGVLKKKYTLHPQNPSTYEVLSMYYVIHISIPASIEYWI